LRVPLRHVATLRLLEEYMQSNAEHDFFPMVRLPNGRLKALKGA
jgi:hypothetical protein